MRAGGMDENGPKVFSVLAGGSKSAAMTTLPGLSLEGEGQRKTDTRGLLISTC